MIDHYKNLSLENIVQEYEGVVMEEEWRPVSGYEGLYEVSSFGRIKSLETVDSLGRVHPARIIKSFSSYKYRRAGLFKDKKQVKYQVHRLVALEFIPNPNNLPEVNHKRGIRYDNRAWELEWSTCADNHKHAYEKLNKVANKPWKGKSGDKHFRSISVLKVSLDGFIIDYYGSKSETARRTSSFIDCITRYINKKSSFKGYYLM